MDMRVSAKTFFSAALALLLVVGLVGCSSKRPTRGKMVTNKPLIAANYRANGIPAAYGDVDPVEWGALAPSRYSVHGIDAARYQGEINWPQVKAAGIKFAWLKATEGGDHLDPGFSINAPRARAAGVPVGGYHFYYFCRSPREQADWFIANVPRRAGDLPPVLDMEWNHLSRSCRHRPDGPTVRENIRIFSSVIRAHYGTAPVVYVTPDFYEDNDLGRMPGVEFWLRSVAAHPSERYPNERWTFWQYTGSGVVPGVNGKVDINAFAGSLDTFGAWLAARSQK